MSLRPQGKEAIQPERFTSQRTAFAPALVRYANLAPQTVADWSSAAGTATVTASISAPDSTTSAATLSTTAPPSNYRRIYSAERTINVGDYLIAGVWVKAGSLSQGANQADGTMEGFGAATLRVIDDTEGYAFDIDGLNYRQMNATAAADTRWEWVATNVKIENAPSGNSATLAFDLNCDTEHSISFYAPLLWHIPADELTDDDIDSLMLGLYSVPDSAESGIIATLKSQSFQSKLRDAGGQVFNVRAAGAVGDGTSDDTAAIQSVIDAAELNTSTGYRTVLLPAGTFYTSGLTATGNVRIVGSGDKETVLYSTANAPILELAAGEFEMPVIENIRIRGSVGAGSSQIGLKVDDPTYGLRCHVSNVWIENCGGNGLYVGNAFSSLFENIYITNCNEYPFLYNAPNMPGNVFQSCYVGLLRDNAPTAYRVKAGDCVLRNCNGVNSFNTDAKWAVVGKKSGVDGDGSNYSAVLELVDCNLESWTDTGIVSYYASTINLRGLTVIGPQPLSSTLDGGINNSVTTITVASTLYWPNAGTVEVGSERITYTGKTATTITGCTRGAESTSAASHLTGVTITVLPICIRFDLGNDGIDYYAQTLQRGIIDDSVRFASSGLSIYARNQAIHAAGFAPIMTHGQGPRVTSAAPLATYWDSVAGKVGYISRGDATLPYITLTGSYSFPQPGPKLIYVNHSAPATVTLPWPGWYQQGELVVVKDVSSGGASVNNITVNANGGGTVNGSSYTLNTDKQAIAITPDGSGDWRIVADYSPGGGVTGSGVASRVAFWSGTSAITSDADLTFDGFNLTAGRLYHSGGSAGAPGVASSGDSGTGFYLSSTGVYGFASSAANSGAGGNVLLLGGDSLTVDGRFILTEKTAPSTPSANSLIIYAKDKSGVSSLYWKNDAGTEFDLSASGGSPGGSDTQLQRNNAGAFGGISGATSNGTNVTFTGGNLIATSPKFTTDISDSNGNELFKLTATASAVNEFTVANAATGSDPTLSATGGDTNISIILTPKGTGVFSTPKAKTTQLIGDGSAPTGSTGTGAGTSPSLSVSDTQLAIFVDLTTGSGSPATNAKIFDVTLATNAPNYYQGFLQPANAAAAALSGNQRPYIDDASAANNKLTVKSGSTGLATGTNYLFYLFAVAV